MLVVVQANGQVPASSLPAPTSACDQAKRSGVVALTVKELDVPSTVAPSFAFRVVVWASYSFSAEAVPMPSVNVTAVAEAGYSGAVPLGALAGPLHASV